MWGSQLLQVITHAQWEDTQMHTGPESRQMSKICMNGVTHLRSGERRVFFSLTHANKYKETLTRALA